MNTLAAFAMGAATRNNPMRVFDWDKAATYIKTEGITEAYAGLEEDWEWTAGKILTNGEPIFDEYTFLASTWATPVLYTPNGAVECWSYESECPFESDSKWPQSALDILGGNNVKDN